MSDFSVTLENKIRAREYKLFLSVLVGVAVPLSSLAFYMELGPIWGIIGVFLGLLISVPLCAYSVRINYPISVSISEEGILFKYAGKNRPLRIKTVNGLFGPKNIRLAGSLFIDWRDIKAISVVSNSNLFQYSFSKIIFTDDSWQSLYIVDNEIIDEIMKGYELFKSEEKR